MNPERKKKRPISLKIREEVLERDGYKCIFCKTTQRQCIEVYGTPLNLHHILLDGALPLKDRHDEPVFLCSVCVHCHSTLHALLRKLIDYLQSPSNHLIKKLPKV